MELPQFRLPCGPRIRLILTTNLRIGNTMNNTITGKVTATKRHGHTAYGNPVMSIQFDTAPGAWFRISDNAGIVYAIENREYRDTPHTFTLNRAGRISGCTR